MNSEHWHVLGAGAIGCLVGGALAQPDYPVTLLLRDTAQDPSSHVEVTRGDSRLEIPVSTQSTAAPHTIDKLLITTKAYDVLAAAQSVAHRLRAGTEVVLLVNGMGIAEQLAALLPMADIYLGTTTEGAYRTGPLQVCHAGRGTTRIGRPDLEQAPPWFRRWRECSLHCEWDSAIETALWSKLAVNSVINPLTALHRCRNGELASRPELAAQVADLCRETTQVSYAAGFTRTAQTLAETVNQVIKDTAANRSSMLQDVTLGRPTEIDFITGYLLAVAEQHAIVAPRNLELLQRIKNLD